MWSLDWFAARDLARAGTLVRRVAWPSGTWLAFSPGLWWFLLPDMTWRIALGSDFGESDFRARDWTSLPYHADICGSLPAFNTAPPVDRSWGDIPEMRPRPVPNFPDA